MKVALAQINTTPGAFEQHLQRIEIALREASNKDCDLVVFPELTTCGYLSADLLYRHEYVDHNLSLFQAIVTQSIQYPEITIVFGYIRYNSIGTGKPFLNSAVVVRAGRIIGDYNKQLLPFYDVFDEGRYFEPGDKPCIIKIGNYRCGVVICEDLWNDKGQDDYNHKFNPVEEYRELGCDVLISLNSSPYTVDKPQQRLKMLEEISRESGMAILYCNQVGAQDELIFDGHSAVISRGRTVAFAEKMEETLLAVDLDNCGGEADKAASKINQTIAQKVLTLREALVMGLREYVTKSGFNQVVLGSSGGIDSAVVAALACEALGAENVHCIMMPSKWSSEGSVVDARELHEKLGCKEYLVPIDHEPFLHHINCGLKFEEWVRSDMNHPVPIKQYKKLVNYHPVADENIQARMRGQIVMHFSNAVNALPLTTGNKTELALGYCTLYGDMNGGFNPICDLYKLRVYQLAKLLGVPKSIIDKPPSAELAPGQTDEKGLKLPYTILDVIVRAYIEDHIASYQTFCEKASSADWYTEIGQQAEVLQWLHTSSQELYDSLIRRIDIMEFKRRQAAPGLKVSRVAFGTGRRIPIVKKV